MGCYDEVIIHCPRCGHEVIEQSKAGKCAFEEYLLEEAPPEIVVEFDGWVEECPECGHSIRVRVLRPQAIVI